MESCMQVLPVLSLETERAWAFERRPTMSDLISKSALKKNVTDGWLKGEEADTHITFVYEADIDNAPTIEVEPRKHGRWIADTYWHGYHCSMCGNQRSYIEVQVINYCPNCGADMREVEE